jgi:quercetin dioxygenase-like cupin family protein
MRTAIVAALAAAAASAPLPDLSSLNPAALKALVPEKVEWKAAAGIGGTETAVLVGDPDKPGFYVVMNRFHPGNFSRPHYHPGERHIMVLSGTWWVGTGSTWDPERRTVPLKAGTFVTHTAREVHYDGARTGSGDAVVMIFGQGPGTRVDCSTQTGPGPCADAPK